ncbi:hypothetical protein [Actinomycetospora sp. NBRC 106378]|uniref:hypothetical protein n=1 Tax=Actinomycetospora sp. NBRC 106378 TaxID=3032208 RepID=UPI0024A36F7E|nr:hypothetical protein [Actinomycetospora sp. NBRC 106378]GLZ51340.1 hypothetical protein Acsp07_09570 [Actinomycetospora sp. NBRC 106378]
MTTPQPLLRELIDIPERVHQGDFVLKLTEGVSDRLRTVEQYVVTPQLRVAFDEALGLIDSALAEGRSKATYLHGSFGSGKSHFMAVLDALLDGDVSARSKPEFADTLARYHWLGEKRFLQVPFHLIGAETLESAILGDYVKYIQAHHPGAPLPAVYRAQGLLDDTRRQREILGDEAFLAQLPASGDDEWGDLEAGWTPERLDAAFAAGPESSEARALISDVVPVFFPNYTRTVQGSANAFVTLDAGLAAISRHAKALGFDGVVLFLDELVLWLAGRIGNDDFVRREAEKVAKLVESSDANRPIPIVSLIARQRDLRELIGQHGTGAESLSFQDQLSYWDGRFGRVDLEDRNLEMIAEKRVLKPVSESAREQIAAAFARTDRLPGATRDVLLSDGDAEGFRRTYPFSPAFMATLIEVSSALQRERTAIKLMWTILVERRDDLRLGQIVPLGDLYDAIADGADQPFTHELKVQFDQARSLYEHTLRPLLLEQRSMTEEQAQRRAPVETAAWNAFRSDDRLVKTLLLAALAPHVGALQGLTARRLAHLNHGTVTSMIPGQEVAEVVRRLRTWASRVAELKVGDEDDPSVRLQLVGIDLSVIYERVAHVDNAGAQRRLVRDLLFAELGVKHDGGLDVTHTVTWRGSRRVLEIVYGNVRDRTELRDELFEPSQSDRWRLVIDYPFDQATHNAADDLARVRDLRAAAPRNTVAWLPAFVTGDVQRKIGTLVRIDHLLFGNRLQETATHLGPEDRYRAIDLLRNQGDSLRAELRTVLRQAYGLAKPDSASVLDWSQHLASLDPTFSPELGVGRPFADALDRLVDQCFAHTFPQHPDFDPQHKGTAVTAAELRTVLDVVRRAAESEDQRLSETERQERPALQRVAHPLRLGELLDGPFTLDRFWERELDRLIPDDEPSVGQVRRSIPKEYGLDPKVANLVILTYAELGRRSWSYRGDAIEPPNTVDDVRDEMVLRRARLPEPEVWATAVERAAVLFGANLDARVRSPRSVARMARTVTAAAATRREPAADLLAVLEKDWALFGVDPTDNPARGRTATVAVRVLDALRVRSEPTEVAEALAEADLDEVPLRTLLTSMSSANDVTAALRGVDRQIFEHLRASTDERAQAIRSALAEGAAADELVVSLRKTLADAHRATVGLITQTVGREPVIGGSSTGKSVVTTGATGAGAGESGSMQHRDVGPRDEVLARLRDAVSKDATIDITYRVVER